MSHRTAITIWFCCGIAPFLSWSSSVSSTPARWLVTLAWLAGWVCLWQATRDPTRQQLLGCFASTHIARLAAALWLLIGLAGLFWIGGSSGLFFALMPPLGLLALWASSSDGIQLRKRTAGALCTIAALAFSIVGLEMTLRWIHARRPANDYRTITWGHPVTTNRFGFREREFKVPKPSGTYRVMVLGDSFTWGSGLSLEERYTERIQRHLRQRFPERNIEVLNFGQPSTPTTEHARNLTQFVDRVTPDRIVVGFCVNDPQPRAQNYAVELDNYRWLFLGIETLGRCRLVATRQFLKTRCGQLLRNIGVIPQWWIALDRVYQPDSTEWQAFCAALKSIKAHNARRGLPPPLFAALWYGRGNFNQPDTRLRLIAKWCRQATRAAQTAGFEIVDMEPAFLRQGDRNRWVNAWDGHPSAECNRIYAEHLSRPLAAALRNTASD